MTISSGLVGNPRVGRTTQVVRIPIGWDKQQMIDLYVLIYEKYEARRLALESGAENKTRDWTQFDKLMEEVESILD